MGKVYKQTLDYYRQEIFNKTGKKVMGGTSECHEIKAKLDAGQCHNCPYFTECLKYDTIMQLARISVHELGCQENPPEFCMESLITEMERVDVQAVIASNDIKLLGLLRDALHVVMESASSPADNLASMLQNLLNPADNPDKKN